MDLYQTMQFLATAAVLAGVGGIAWSFWAWSSPRRPGAFLSEPRAVVRVLAVLAVICTSLALAVGMRLFGLAVVLDTLRANVSLFLWSLLVASVGSSGLGIWAGRQQEREREKAERARSLAEQARASAASEPRGPEEEPRVVIHHRRTRKVLWRMAAASFEGADLFLANLRGADLRGADLSGADLRGADLRGAKLGSPEQGVAVEVVQSWVGWIILWLVIVRDQILHHHSAVGVTGLMFYWVFTASLRVIQSWRGAMQSGACLRQATLSAAELQGADLRGATLAGARFDAATRWPAGFDPETHGAVRLS
jgi:hypothetical protein